MELNQLRYVAATAKLGSFAKAAERHFTTRQNVSRAIKELETELGVSLFVRKGNSMTLTPSGEIVAQQAQSIIDTADGIKLLCRMPEKAQPHIRIAISHNLFAGAPSTVSSIIEKNAITDQITEVSCRECYERVCNRMSDVAIVTAMERDFPECRSQKIGSMAAYLLVGENSRLVNKTHYSISDLASIPFVLMPEPEFQYKPLFDLLPSLKGSNDKISTVTSTSSMLHIIKRIDAAAIVTDTYFANVPKGAMAIPINDSRLNWSIYVLYTVNSDNYFAINQIIKDMKASMK